MRSTTTSSFRKCFQGLSPRIQARAREAYRTFAEDPSHPGLHLKQVHPSRPIYSARVSLGYRALAVRDDDAWIWFWIGSHADYDQLLSRLRAAGLLITFKVSGVPLGGLSEATPRVNGMPRRAAPRTGRVLRLECYLMA